MNPDVAEAVASLGRTGTLAPAQVQAFSRVARRQLVSLHAEMRLAAYLGVLLVMAGVGVLVRQNLDRIGPLAIATGLALGAVACLLWVAARAPAFTWGEVASPHLALDYVLLLGALLVGADLAYAEAEFTTLGHAWPWHLLIVAVLYALLAFRYDSRVLLSLALSTFAAWRGVSAALLEHAVWRSGEDPVRLNAAACGLLFLALGAVLRRRSWKPHFEPVTAHLGWLLLLGAVGSGLGTRAGSTFAVVLVGLAGVLAAVGWRQRRFSLMALAILAAYAGVSALAVRTLASDLPVFWWFAITPLMVVAVLFVAHRYVREPE
jgi:hypothetical protein